MINTHSSLTNHSPGTSLLQKDSSLNEEEVIRLQQSDKHCFSLVDASSTQNASTMLSSSIQCESRLLFVFLKYAYSFIWCFCSTREWSSPKLLGDPPSPRGGHSATLVG